MQYHGCLAPVTGILTIRENSGAFSVVLMKKVAYQPAYCSMCCSRGVAGSSHFTLTYFSLV